MTENYQNVLDSLTLLLLVVKTFAVIIVMLVFWLTVLTNKVIEQGKKIDWLCNILNL